MDPVDVAVWVALSLLCVLFLWGIATYNKLIRLRNRVDAVWADIDVQLKRRHDLVPNLVEVVEGYATHERGTLDEVTRARTTVEAASSPAERASAENELSDALVRLFATAEDYPELQAEERFQELHEDLRRLEDVIAMSRQAYNLAVLAYNNTAQTVPTNLVAWMGSFERREFLSAPAGDAEVPQVDLDLPPVPVR
ncbi:MAG TPA: LemA family protein [Gaiellaceae bacterium]|nr:LemA family protein [Gaiellaceae bacterium]